jgi:hypothetical protein
MRSTGSVVVELSKQALKMGTEMAPETWVISNQLTRLIAQDFINFSRRESFSSHNTVLWGVTQCSLMVTKFSEELQRQSASALNTEASDSSIRW